MNANTRNAAVLAAVMMVAFAGWKSYQSSHPLRTAMASPGPASAKPDVEITDINSASIEALVKLPGIDEEAAKKIIAGRPYGSKMWLVSDNIISETTFQGLRDRVAAKQSQETMAVLRERALAAVDKK